MVTLSAPNGTFELRLHESLARGLFSSVGLGGYTQLGLSEADAIDEWANTECDNPKGQRADLARAVALLIRVHGALSVRSVGEGRPEARTIWDTV